MTADQALMALYTEFENVEPWPLVRKENRSVLSPTKPRLKADPAAGAIEIDSLTRLEGIPPAAWDYHLGNRSALEWILEEYIAILFEWWIHGFKSPRRSAPPLLIPGGEFPRAGWDSYIRKRRSAIRPSAPSLTITAWRTTKN